MGFLLLLIGYTALLGVIGYYKNDEDAAEALLYAGKGLVIIGALCFVAFVLMMVYWSSKP